MEGLPTFLVIGAQKSGTGTLYHHLRDHPQVYVSTVKEPDFFTAEPGGRRSWEWYRELFRPGAERPQVCALGEASTSYTMYPAIRGVPERIAAALPDAKLVYLVRDPVDRMRSAYRHAVSVGEERRPVEVALHDPRYADVSRYALQLGRYLRCFDRERILVMQAERLFADPVGTMRRVFAFLDVDPEVPLSQPDRRHNVGDQRVIERRWLVATERLARRWDRARDVRRVRDRVQQRVPVLVGRPFPPGSTEVCADLRAELLETVRADVAELLSIAPDLDGWGVL
jgi:hypothetical protein